MCVLSSVPSSVVIDGVVPVCDTSNPLVGTVLGGFKVKGVFRSAGYMSTCLVENVRKPGLTMVLKCDPKVDALLQEYRMCQRVSDIPGTVRVREWIYLTQKSDVCAQLDIRCGGIVMEYHKGISGYLPWAPIGTVAAQHDHTHFFTYFKQLLEILIVLKRRGLVHTDICPRNVVYDEQSSSLTLLDFGSTVEDGGDDHVNRSLLWRTPFNSAPETEGVSRPTIRSYTDVWAVGVMYLMAILHLREAPEPREIKQLLRTHATNPCIDAALVMLDARKHTRDPEAALSKLQAWNDTCGL